jgi:hypothetical protein
LPLKQANEVSFDLMHEIFKRIKKATKYFIMFVGLFNFLRRLRKWTALLFKNNVFSFKNN